MKLNGRLIWLMDFILRCAAGVCFEIWPSHHLLMYIFCVCVCLCVCMCVCSCVCPPGFEGHRCEINPDDCEDNDCENNSTCIDGVNNYTCICPPNYTGIHTHAHTNLHAPSDIPEILSFALKRLRGSPSPSTNAHAYTPIQNHIFHFTGW